MKIDYIHEPDDLQCGQAVLAMLLNKDVAQVADELANYRETTLKEMKDHLRNGGFIVSDKRIQVSSRDELPDMCFLSLETPCCWHWSLYHAGVFYDPEHGVMDDFPEAARKFYWEVRIKDAE